MNLLNVIAFEYKMKDYPRKYHTTREKNHSSHKYLFALNLKTWYNSMALYNSCYISLYEGIFHFQGNDDASVAFLAEHSLLLHTRDCPNCNIPCYLCTGRNIWCCYKVMWHCGYSISTLMDTFLEVVHFRPWKVLPFLNHSISRVWSHKSL